MMRVLQITDLHVLSQPDIDFNGVESLRAVERVLEAAFSDDAKPELIIATGDLAEDGAEASYRRLRKVLLKAGVPVLALPGNHDDVESIKAVLAGGVVQAPFLHDAGGWRFVCLNTQISDEGHGRISEREWAALERVLSDDPYTPVLIALHHAPIAACHWAGCQLEGANKFLTGLSRHPQIKAIISGHLHLASDHQHEGIRVLTTPATCVQAMHFCHDPKQANDDFHTVHQLDPLRHGFRILDLMPDGGIETHIGWVHGEIAA